MIDLTKIYVHSGNGGNGCISFRREKFIPYGGPDGGDGGHGGNVYVLGDPSLNTLLHLKYHTTWRAPRGSHGRGQQKTGANAPDINVAVPVGTLIWKLDKEGNRELLADVSGSEAVLVARGGAGGLGNKRFATSVNQEPVLAEKGGEGESASLLLELKLLADVGLIGKPNAGKSTLLSMCSAARPKVAAYPFTTTDPVLGVVATRDSSFVMMEVPGLIEGAHMGVGLGHEFLRHVERSRLLIHIVDGLAPDPMEDWRSINHELTAFDISLAEKPQFVVLNKMDVTEVRESIPELRAQLEKCGVPVFAVSAATGEGVEALLGKVLEKLATMPLWEGAPHEEVPATTAPRESSTFTVTREGGVFVVRAPRVERLIPLADLRDWRAMIQVWHELDRLGVVKALEESGVKIGDTVRLGSVELEWT